MVCSALQLVEASRHGPCRQCTYLQQSLTSIIWLSRYTYQATGGRLWCDLVTRAWIILIMPCDVMWCHTPSHQHHACILCYDLSSKLCYAMTEGLRQRHDVVRPRSLTHARACVSHIKYVGLPRKRKYRPVSRAEILFYLYSGLL